MQWTEILHHQSQYAWFKNAIAQNRLASSFLFVGPDGVGASTRATIAFYRAAQAYALINGRDHVIPDDIKELAVPVLAHRIVPKGMLPGADRSAAEEVLNQVLRGVRVPV